MKHLANFAALALVLLACGCSGKERAIEPSYVGKVEVVRDGAVIGGRDYRCIVREISVSPDRLRVHGRFTNAWTCVTSPQK